MNILNTIIKKPPNQCIFCNSNKEKFSSEEHIVPQSLGNHFLTLEKGWVCDKCNNICSAFESKVINHTIFGAERAMLGVITKKGKPARSKFGKLHWNTSLHKKGAIEFDKKDIDKHPFLSKCFKNGQLIIPFHSKFDIYIAKLLLKIGIESKYMHSGMDKFKFNESKQFVIGKNNNSWPYVLIQQKNISTEIFTSAFSESKYLHSHALASGFDIFFYDIHKKYDIDESIVLFFKYGHFTYGINLSSRKIEWFNLLKDAQIEFIKCPIEFNI